MAVPEPGADPIADPAAHLRPPERVASLIAAGVSPDWAAALAPVAPQLTRVSEYLRGEEAAGHTVLPAEDLRLAAFARPLAEVRVLIIGQDPYPTPGHAIGLSFATDRAVRPLPRSLANLYRELHDDLGISPAPHGDLSSWNEQGVMLLNRALSVRAGEAGSHRLAGWNEVTDHAVRVLAARGGPLVAVLWGADARSLAPLLSGVDTVESVHPSPLSAARGFFGSRPFSRVNTSLRAQGAQPIDWRVGAPPAIG